LSERPGEELPSMPFMQHLAELRSALITVAVILAAGTGAAWFVARPILSALTRLLPPEASANYFSPAESFMVLLKVSFITALFVCVPLIFYRIWRFVAPGLYRHEKSKIVPLFLASALLFYLGTIFAYLEIVPMTLNYFGGLQAENVKMTINISQLFTWVAKFCISFGIVFQLPLVILILSLLGLVSPVWLLRQWRHAIIIVLVISAVMTPPDVVSQVAMALPVIVLYFASAIIALVVGRRRPRSVDSPENL
jgi:sec-independent protein translocase protein TatC